MDTLKLLKVFYFKLKIEKQIRKLFFYYRHPAFILFSSPISGESQDKGSIRGKKHQQKLYAFLVAQ